MIFEVFIVVLFYYSEFFPYNAKDESRECGSAKSFV
jgi:hypothetical protein